mmetsp:Transcript_105908/g.147677  ORF Transcript_105908/g.147677 Transcript_105908/m.147677 type:complete len:115 (-) Transcript_105908:96-440(-)
MDNLVKGNNIEGTVADLLAKKDFATIGSAVSEVVSNEQNIITAKKVLDALIEKFDGIGNDDMLALGADLLKRITNKNYFELQIARIKETLAEVYAGKGNYFQAAGQLSEINFES